MPRNTSDTSVLASLDGVLQPVLRVAAACYAVGLLIENFSMTQRGSPGFGLVRAQYILVGTSWAVQVGVVYCLVTFCRMISHGSRVRRITTVARLNLVFGGFFLLATVCISSQIMSLLYAGEYWKSHRLAEYIFIWFILVSNIALYACVGLSIEDPFILLRRDTMLVVSLGAPSFLANMFGECDPSKIVAKVFRISFALFAIPIYAHTFFPMIPQTMGGGKLQMVSLYLKKDAAEVFKNIKSDRAPRVNQNAVISRVFLIDDETDGYVITTSQLPVGESYKISKADIELIVRRPYGF